MLRSRLYRYKLSEFSYLTGIDTYRLKKLDQQGILPARTINGRRYYDETAVMLAIFHSDNEYTKPTIHNIVIALGKLLTLVKVYNQRNKQKNSESVELSGEDEIKQMLTSKELEELDIACVFDKLIGYLEQVRNVANTKDKYNLVEDEDVPLIFKTQK